MESIWKRGQQAEIARLAGVSPKNFNDILHRRRYAYPEKARRLSAASKKVLKKEIPWQEFLESRSSTNPYFFGAPKSKRL